MHIIRLLNRGIDLPLRLLNGTAPSLEKGTTIHLSNGSIVIGRCLRRRNKFTVHSLYFNIQIGNIRQSQTLGVSSVLATKNYFQSRELRLQKAHTSFFVASGSNFLHLKYKYFILDDIWTEQSASSSDRRAQLFCGLCRSHFIVYKVTAGYIASIDAYRAHSGMSLTCLY